ncbi:unnamed protein product [Rotaria sordida]|uniref:TIR domain-containing protein n=1 Tax=Rotaria sordida TaxID=392033 RepID=A0A815ARB5_9BILA|nr:unnamed protein product [Rotaria sordida]
MNDVDLDKESSILSWHDYDSSDIEEEAETADISGERIFSDILTKLQNLQCKISEQEKIHKSEDDETKSSANKEDESCSDSDTKASKSNETELSEDDNEERLDKIVLIEWYRILVELVNVIEEHKSNITKQNYFAVRKQTKPLSVIINDSKTWLPDDDTAYAHEIVDLYFNFFHLQHIKNYLALNIDISDAILEYKCKAFRPLLTILYNISRHEDGIQALNALHLVSLLKEIQTTVKESDSYYQEIVEILCMTLALLSTTEQIKNDRKQMNIVLDRILESLVLAAGEEDYRCGFHVSESLVVLVKLFSYDRTLDYIMQHAEVEQLEKTTTLEFLLDFFSKYYATVKNDDPLKLTTMTALCNIFWCVSLRPQYKQELYGDKEKFKEFKKIIEQIACGGGNRSIGTTSIHYVPTYIENIQKAADGILCNIVEQQEQQQQSETQKSERCGVKRLRALALSLRSPSSTSSPNTIKPLKPSIMISYSHGDNDVCTQLYNELNKRNDEFDIWIDRKYCKTGYLWGKIADGMQEASVILCLLSNKYYESKSCQQEFVYANDHLKKQVIPVFIQQDKPPGWVGIHTCLLKYIRFRQTQLLEEEKLKDLMEMIDEYLALNNGKNDVDSSISVMTRPAPVHHETMITAKTTTTTPVTENKEFEIKQQVVYSTKPAINLDEKPISQWNKDDVAQWFQQNKIMLELYKLYQFEDGLELLTYAATILDDNVLKSEQQLYSQAYSQANNGKVLLTPPFSRFMNALRKLHNDAELKTQKSTIVVEPIIMNGSSSGCGKPTARNISRIPRRSSITTPQD